MKSPFVFHFYSIACNELLWYSVRGFDSVIFENVAIPSYIVLGIVFFAYISDNSVNNIPIFSGVRILSTFWQLCCQFVAHQE